MQWSDQAIVLSVRRLGEYSGVVRLLAREHGVYAGVDKAAFGKRKFGVYQPGNVIEVNWKARLAEHMGTFTAELQDALASRLLDSRLALAALSSAVQLVEYILPERDPHPEIYLSLRHFISVLVAGNRHSSMLEYLRLEYALLECSGFGLDLTQCAATGQAHDLCYVSPRSGRAVSREAGLPYHDRLFAFPSFLNEDGDYNALMDGLSLCGHFLHERVFSPRGGRMPETRNRLIAMLKEL